jgi:hypothetical protein
MDMHEPRWTYEYTDIFVPHNARPYFAKLTPLPNLTYDRTLNDDPKAIKSSAETFEPNLPKDLTLIDEPN